MSVNADCGVSYAHDRHLYRTERGKVKACDGDISDKRQTQKTPKSRTSQKTYIPYTGYRF